MNHPDIKKSLVLVVDDIQENLQVLGNILHDKGINFAFAMDGEQALKSVSKRIPDLILLDIQMPGISGYEVCERIKSNPHTKDIPIIFLTAKDQPEDIVEGFNVGGLDYVTKPFNSSVLLARVFTHLELKNSRDVILKQNEDLTHLNDVLNQKNIELKDLINKKNEIMGMVAHDLRNPLTVIRAYSELVHDRLSESDIEIENCKNELTKTIEMVDRMTKLTSDLLSISSIDSGKVTLNLHDEEFLKIISENIEFFVQVALKKNIEVNFHKNEKYPNPIVLVDKYRIIQVFENLLSNAIKYSHSGGKIEISYDVLDSSLITNIKDNGLGLDENDLREVFKSFKKLSARPTGGESSTGLGLAIVKKIINLHKGEIWVKSEKGKGSTFSFSLPLL